MDKWINGYMDTWIHGYMDTGIHGYMDTWIQGYRDTGIHGYMDTWIHGYMDTWKYMGYMDIWTYGYEFRKSDRPSWVAPSSETLLSWSSRDRTFGSGFELIARPMAATAPSASLVAMHYELCIMSYAL